MNERGLVANLLYLDESSYVTPVPGDKRRPLAITAWVQYVLDNYATVAEAVEDMRREPFYVVTMMTPDGHPGQLHLSISDATGDSAIFEYLDGKLVVHHGRQYQVMTNSPPYDDQLALDAYWRTVGGNAMLPGTYRPADRFVRMAFYAKDVKKTKDPVEAVATGFSLIRNASVPIGVNGPPNEPNVAETLWRTVADHRNLVYFFESTRSPNVVWVRLADVDFAPSQPARKLKLAQGEIYAGNTVSKFEATEPFKFLPAEVK